MLRAFFFNLLTNQPPRPTIAEKYFWRDRNTFLEITYLFDEKSFHEELKLP